MQRKTKSSQGWRLEKNIFRAHWAFILMFIFTFTDYDMCCIVYEMCAQFMNNKTKQQKHILGEF